MRIFIIPKEIKMKEELDSYYLNQLLDEIEADIADTKNTKLLNKFIALKDELVQYFAVADDLQTRFDNVKELIEEIKGEL